MSRSAAHDERNTSFREAFRTPFEFASSAAPTAQLVQTETQKLKLEHDVEDIPNSNGARLHWIGDRSAEKVLLYFHGGGFCLPALNGHILFLNQTQQYLESKGKKIVIAFLEYNGSEGSRYPAQIFQGTEALRFVLEKGWKPSNIVIGGDSAGANLAITTISVVLHSFPGIPPLSLSGHLAGLLLISAWIGFSRDTQSWTENADKDCIPAECAIQLTDAYADPADRNNYSEPGQADVSWWKGLPADRILNVYGGAEVLRDHIAELGDKLEKAGNRVENVECPLEVHIDCILDAMSGLDAGLMSTKVWEWLSSVL
ncbi:hypothetical protein A1O3_06409 [Capronia epimyces CBS 606.96]|uniref:Alpha/beta hydrolase fold-3 domain-containing protein n=1 Tax=Capronia epimyces CBS 606.96 TaxID=1182542 RepID=W9Y028_9EURO|nr:uncharacterized protein A1O3_06409 [Capronia epimyces CBS 606.96]EXJ82596.1 hypothetical protein A1O3_06409 [Capronia epimyces CBS 606.96]